MKIRPELYRYGLPAAVLVGILGAVGLFGATSQNDTQPSPLQGDVTYSVGALHFKTPTEATDTLTVHVADGPVSEAAAAHFAENIMTNSANRPGFQLDAGLPLGKAIVMAHCTPDSPNKTAQSFAFACQATIARPPIPA